MLFKLHPTSSLSTIVDHTMISTTDVYNELCNLNATKACGPDCITPLMLDYS